MQRIGPGPLIFLWLGKVYSWCDEVAFFTDMHNFQVLYIFDKFGFEAKIKMCRMKSQPVLAYQLRKLDFSLTLDLFFCLSSLAIDLNTPTLNDLITLPTPTELTDVIELPGRRVRSKKVVLLLRGPPGSGKSFLARLIKVPLNFWGYFKMFSQGCPKGELMRFVGCSCMAQIPPSRAVVDLLILSRCLFLWHSWMTAGVFIATSLQQTKLLESQRLNSRWIEYKTFLLWVTAFIIVPITPLRRMKTIEKMNCFHFWSCFNLGQDTRQESGYFLALPKLMFVPEIQLATYPLQSLRAIQPLWSVILNDYYIPIAWELRTSQISDADPPNEKKLRVIK